MVLKGYFDDSGDDKRRRFSAVGGLIGSSGQWQAFDVLWSIATYELKGPFRSADCEAQRGCCAGWTVEKSASLMARLTKIVGSVHLGGFGAIVPIQEYRAVFPDAGEYDPYFLALKHTIINMAYLCRLAALSGNLDSVKICHEEGSTSGGAFEIYSRLKAVPGWIDAKYLAGFSVDTKELAALQGADLIAREAFKHADNLGVRKTRKPVKALQQGLSFHLWTRESLEYLRAKGGPDHLEALTTWGQIGEQVPQMVNWFAQGFNRNSGNVQ